MLRETHDHLHGAQIPQTLGAEMQATALLRVTTDHAPASGKPLNPVARRYLG
jgi:hypothetical protein